MGFEIVQKQNKIIVFCLSLKRHAEEVLKQTRKEIFFLITKKSEFFPIFVLEREEV